jgi:endonuclease/exonuclease/phosphatase family metal-dependent hydrolase
MPLRIVSWNLGHQTRLVAIPPRFLDAVRAMAPDVLLLNEYVHDDVERLPLLEGLQDLGLFHYLVSEQIMRPARIPGGKPLQNNQVLSAARFPLLKGALRGPPVADNGGEANFLHVIVDALSIELVGIRVPAYGAQLLLPYWEAFVQLANTVVDRKICFVGDFNADPDRTGDVVGKRFAGLRDQGWRIPRARGDWSFKSGSRISRIDHALASLSFPHIAAHYVSSYGDLILAGSEAEAISDHAALVIDLEASIDAP